MGKHWPGNYVSDSKNSRNICLERFVDLDKAPLIHFHPELFKTEPGCERSAANRGEHDITFNRFRLTAISGFNR